MEVFSFEYFQFLFLNIVLLYGLFLYNIEKEKRQSKTYNSRDLYVVAYYTSTTNLLVYGLNVVSGT